MHKNKNKPLAWFGGVLLVVALIAALVVTRNRSQAQTTTPAGEVVTAFIGDLSAAATASGAVQAKRHASLAAQTPGLVTAVPVHVGDMVQAGDLLIQLDDSELALSIANAAQTVRLRQASLDNLRQPAHEADIAAAEAAVASAQANLDDVIAGPTATEIAIGEAGVRTSQASLYASAAELARVQSSIAASQITAAQAALLAAQATLDNAREVNEDGPTAANHQAMLEAEQSVANAQAQLDDLLAGPNANAEQSSVAAANARVDGSEADLNKLLVGPTETEIISAQLQLAQAQASLAALLAGASETDIATATAEVEQARLSLADAEEALTKAAITAPFAGIVTAVHVSEGEIASGIVVELVDTTNLEVVLQVDEIDIGNITAGQQAVITLETWPDVEINSSVAAIAPGAQTSVGTTLVTYDVHLTLGATDLPVRMGMTANANLITAQKEGVLLVPNRAINVDRNAGTYSVNRIIGATTEVVEVAIGLRDGQHTQILHGLNTGDELLVTNGIPVENFGPGPGDNSSPFGD